MRENNTEHRRSKTILEINWRSELQQSSESIGVKTVKKPEKIKKLYLFGSARARGVGGGGGPVKTDPKRI